MVQVDEMPDGKARKDCSVFPLKITLLGQIRLAGHIIHCTSYPITFSCHFVSSPDNEPALPFHDILSYPFCLLTVSNSILS